MSSRSSVIGIVTLLTSCLSYVEGWKGALRSAYLKRHRLPCPPLLVINLANEVFGFNGWSSQIMSLNTDFVRSLDWEDGIRSPGFDERSIKPRKGDLTSESAQSSESFFGTEAFMKTPATDNVIIQKARGRHWTR